MLEKSYDKKMNRTKLRELVTGEISIAEAYGIVAFVALIGGYVALKINIQTMIVCILTVVIYVGVYTPLKRKSWINTHVGAIPGALPLLGGGLQLVRRFTWQWLGFFLHCFVGKSLIFTRYQSCILTTTKRLDSKCYQTKVEG